MRVLMRSKCRAWTPIVKLSHITRQRMRSETLYFEIRRILSRFRARSNTLSTIHDPCSNHQTLMAERPHHSNLRAHSVRRFQAFRFDSWWNFGPLSHSAKLAMSATFSFPSAKCRGPPIEINQDYLSQFQLRFTNRFQPSIRSGSERALMFSSLQLLSD